MIRHLLFVHNFAKVISTNAPYRLIRRLHKFIVICRYPAFNKTYLALGAEVFHQTPNENDGESSTGFNAGAIINFGDLHHLLLSAVATFQVPTRPRFM